MWLILVCRRFCCCSNTTHALPTTDISVECSRILKHEFHKLDIPSAIAPSRQVLVERRGSFHHCVHASNQLDIY
jgi:hypothetical protein